MLSGAISAAQQKKRPRTRGDTLRAQVGKPRGGLSTKIHAAVDALGCPVRLLLTAGQVSGHTQAGALVDGFRASFVLADLCPRGYKGYDSDAFVETIKAGGATRYERLALNYMTMLSLASILIWLK